MAHYRLTLPPDLPAGSLTARARVLWRKFDRAYTEFAFGANPAGFAEFDEVPDLPITEIASDEVVIGVGGRVDPVSTEEQDEEIWVRYNDYGIALLREGNDASPRRPSSGWPSSSPTAWTGRSTWRAWRSSPATSKTRSTTSGAPRPSVRGTRAWRGCVGGRPPGGRGL